MSGGLSPPRALPEALPPPADPPDPCDSTPFESRLSTFSAHAPAISPSPSSATTHTTTAPRGEVSEGMGQRASSQQHLVLLQEQLERSVMRSDVDIGAVSIRSFVSSVGELGGEDGPREEEEGEDGVLLIPGRGRKGATRQRRRSAGSDTSLSSTPFVRTPSGGDEQRRTTTTQEQATSLASPSKRTTKPRRVSSYIPSSAWAGQLSQLAFPARSNKMVATPSSPASTSRLKSTPPRPRSSGGLPTNPPSSASSSSTSLGIFPSKRSLRPAPTPSYRTSLLLSSSSLLPSIPGSPLPLLSPSGPTPGFMTRSASSPPFLPTIAAPGAISPGFALQPPTAGLVPSSGWPVGEGGEEGRALAVARPRRASSLGATTRNLAFSQSQSEPNLSLLAIAPIEGTSACTVVTPISTSSASPSSRDQSPFFVSSPSPVSLTPTDLSPSASALSDVSPLPSPSEILDAPLLSHSPQLLAADAEAERLEELEGEERRVLDEKRYLALVELVETEKGYLEGLRVLVKVYFRTLPFLTFLTVPEVHAIVRNSEALLALHERIGDRIEQVEREIGWRRVEGEERSEREERQERAQKARTTVGRIAKVFSDELPNFTLYHEFCARHAEALDITRSVSSRQEWEAFERQCALRASRGDTTPLASRQNSTSFFPPVTPPPSSSTFSSGGNAVSGIASASSTSTPSSIASTATQRPAPSAPASSATTSSSSSRSKLRFIDYAIAPIQRITRYPLVFGQLAKYSAHTYEHASIQSTWAGFKAATEGVNQAKRQREGEMRTRVVAQRMDFPPLVGGAFCDVLGPTLLVGALHVVHHGAGASASLGGAGGGGAGGGPGGAGGGGQAETLKARYLGCFLYQSHLVLAKIRKRASYEPREWLPLRLVEIRDLEDGQGLLTNSIRLTFRDHHFELGALCPGEKAIWLSQLLGAQSEARETWETQSLDEQGYPTLFDDTVVSSIPAKTRSMSAGALPPQAMRAKSHTRTVSSASVASVFAASPVMESDEPLPPLPADLNASTTSSVAPSLSHELSSTSNANSSSTYGSSLMTTPQLSSRSRFSTTASSLLLGRTPSSQRAAVDLRLGDVFSDPLLAARAQAAREAADEQHHGGGGQYGSMSSAKRLRTVSGPKRSMTAGLASAVTPYAPYVMPASTAAKMLGSATSGGAERRRMSAVEIGRAEFRGALSLDTTSATVVGHRDEHGFVPLSPTRANSAGPIGGLTPDRKGSSWASAIRKTKSTGGAGSVGHGSKHRPALPEIDTALAETMARSSAGGGGKKGLATPLSAGGSWSRRSHGTKGEANGGGAALGGQLRRAASHSSMDRMITGAVPTSNSSTAAANNARQAPPQQTTTTTDVERNNSVSSSASSNDTGARSASSHASHLIETPPSSIPPSPDFNHNMELVDPLSCAVSSDYTRSSAPPARKPTVSTSPPTPQQLAASSHVHQIPVHSSPRSMLDGFATSFRLRRRKSTLGLVPPAMAPISPSPSTDDLGGAPAPSPSLTLVSTPSREESLLLHSHNHPHDSKALKLQRRASTTLTGLFSAKKRAQSSPALAGQGGYFAHAMKSSPNLSLTSSSTSPAPSPYHSPATSTSTSPASSQPVTPAGGTTLELHHAPPPQIPQSSPQKPSMVRRKTSGPGAGGGGGEAGVRRRGTFFGMAFTPMS